MPCAIKNLNTVKTLSGKNQSLEPFFPAFTMVCAEPEVWREENEQCPELLPTGFAVCLLLWGPCQWRVCNDSLSPLSPGVCTSTQKPFHKFPPEAMCETNLKLRTQPAEAVDLQT